MLFSEAVDADGRPDARLASLLRDSTSAQLAPRPPIAAGPIAAIAGATAMLDLSDGLALDAARIAKASGIRIDFASAALGPDIASALNDGEDHSLLAAFPAEAVLPPEFRRIGRCETGTGITVDGVQHDASGWDPYREWNQEQG